MKFTIEFTWKRKDYTATVTQVQGVYMVETEKGDTYLLAKDGPQWFCNDLKSEIVQVIGRSIEERMRS